LQQYKHKIAPRHNRLLCIMNDLYQLLPQKLVLICPHKTTRDSSRRKPKKKLEITT
jgi:histidinol phosphatase-like enzyme